MNLAVLGINFRSAPIELRETVSFRPEQIPDVLRRVGERLPGAERVLVSTCNRTELYVAAHEELPGKEGMVAAVMTGADASAAAASVEHFYLRTGADAVEHAIAVASSLDSMVVGETEILGQVKQAFVIASGEETSGKMLNNLFQAVFRYAKRVHTETDICRGRVSVSSIAVEFAEKVFEDMSEKTVMIVGAGETAELALKSLVEKGVTEVLVLNRSFHRGKALAEQYGGRAIQFELLADYLPRTDIVISSTGAPHCVIQADAVRDAIRARMGRPILLIDIAMPRDVDAAAGRLENVYLYHIDDLQRVADENLATRQKAIDSAWQIVRAGAAELAAQFAGADIGTLMREFEQQARGIKEEELNRTFAKEKMSGLSEECREEVSQLVQKTINKLLAAPRAALHRAAKDGQWPEYSRVVRDLFGFDKEKDE